MAAGFVVCIEDCVPPVVFPAEEDEHIRLSIVAANNHYVGFGPGTANIFRNMLGLADAKWENREMKEEEKQEQQHPLHHDMKQRSISDFIS